MDYTISRVHEFDQEHADALRRIWVVGDVHGHIKPLLRALERSPLPAPNWLVMVGDIDLDPEAGSFREWLAPAYRLQPHLQVAFVPGNHDSDQQDRWKRLSDCGAALPLHGCVIDMNGVRVAGLGGVFLGRVWRPPQAPVESKRRDFARQPLRRNEHAQPGLLAAIYEDEWLALGCQRADVLVTHEAPSCHPHGFEAIDDLARALRAVRSFHGHHHDDLTTQYQVHRARLGFDAVALGFCAIKTAAGELVSAGMPSR